jgi:hypothetical protein
VIRWSGNAGHVTHFDQPEQWTHALEDFLT